MIRAADRGQLQSRVARLARWLERNATVDVKDLAFSLNTQMEPGGSRLAVVAGSAAELKTRLDQALPRLADPNCHSIRVTNGSYWFERPLHPEGKLALLFPGENAQYPHMLADLMPHFPEVADWFNWADHLIPPRGPDTPLWSLPLSQVVYPPPGTPPEQTEQLIRLLHYAIPAVMMGNHSLLMIFKQLGLWVDAIAGHSAGESSALGAAGCIDFNFNSLREHAEANFDVEFTAGGPEAVLYAVGAGRDRLQGLLEHPRLVGRVFIGMDNCPHQSVLVASPEDHEFIAKELERLRLPAERLPYRRPHHTPLIKPLLDIATRTLHVNRIRLPHTTLYSCSTGQRFPDDLEEITRIAREQWMRPVEFTKMIRTMHDDGVRFFVECGPRGNLTGFVDDILRGRDYVAVAGNMMRRPAVTQLNHVAGLLLAHHVPLRLDYFYVRRHPRKIVWDTVSDTPRPAVVSQPVSTKKTDIVREVLVPEPPADEPTVVAAAPSSRVRIMADFAQVMEQFLDTQREVMEAFLIPASGGRKPPAEDAESGGLRPPLAASVPPESGGLRPPLAASVPTVMLGEIAQHDPGRELVALRPLSLAEDLFAADHTLGGRDAASSGPPQHGQPVMPMTFSMESMAEAAAFLAPGLTVVGMRRVRLGRWIVFDDETTGCIRITARVVEPESGRTRVQVVIHQQTGEGADGPQWGWAAEGTVLLAEHYPEAPPPAPLTLTNERPAAMTVEGLYGALIHGPIFQAVTDTGRMGDNGVEGRLRVLSHRGLFRSTTEPRLLTDAVLLDAATHILGVWHLSQEDLAGRVIFPVELGAVDWFAPPPPTGQEFLCRVHIESVSARTVRHTLDLIGPDGRLWCRMSPIDYWRFYVPFFRINYRPFRGHFWIGEDVTDTVDGGEGACVVRTVLAGDVRQPVLRDAAARMCLNRAEWPAYRAVRHDDQECNVWFFRRSAAKEAIQRLWVQLGHPPLLPADLLLEEDGPVAYRVTYRGAGRLPQALPQVAAKFEDGGFVGVAALDRPPTFPVMTSGAVADPGARPSSPALERRMAVGTGSHKETP